MIQAHNECPDQTLVNAAFDPYLHCLDMSQKRDVTHIWLNLMYRDFTSIKITLRYDANTNILIHCCILAI